MGSNKLVWLLFLAFIIRMASMNMAPDETAPIAAQSVEPAAPEQQEQTEGDTAAPLTESEQLVMASNQVIDSAIYARAHYLLEQARQADNAAWYLKAQRQRVEQTLSEKQDQMGVFDGQAQSFEIGMNGTGEAAAIALANLWLSDPSTMENAPTAYQMSELINLLGGASDDR